MGAEDSVFDTSHVRFFAAALEKQGILHAENIVPGADHAFDMFAESGGSVHRDIITPAVEWVSQFIK